MPPVDMKMYRIDYRMRKRLIEFAKKKNYNNKNKKKKKKSLQIGVKTHSSGQIQNGRHEITKVIISSSIIEIETILFHQTICFRYQGMQ